MEARRWRELNAKHRRGNAPTPNEEWLLYQTLLGAYPEDLMYAPCGNEAFVERIQAYMMKAVREAKLTTSWIAPDEEHEKSVSAFIAAILSAGSPFLERFGPFQRQVAVGGHINSLAQTLLKLAAPGVPDTYQGTELLDFSLVDPDNRRPVDYARRQEMLDELKREVAAAGDGLADFAHELAVTAGDGRAKLYVTWRLLTLRRERPGLFSEGEYLPIEASGGAARSIFAFARRHGDQTAIVAVPLPSTDSRSTLRLPHDLRAGAYRDAFTAEEIPVGGETLSSADIFRRFPIALLLSQ
jgi:(1->4)-alpha-D-glucan 1-alpha-D-glucosylmutase